MCVYCQDICMFPKWDVALKQQRCQCSAALEWKPKPTNTWTSNWEYRMHMHQVLLLNATVHCTYASLNCLTVTRTRSSNFFLICCHDCVAWCNISLEIMISAKTSYSRLTWFYTGNRENRGNLKTAHFTKEGSYCVDCSVYVWAWHSLGIVIVEGPEGQDVSANGSAAQAALSRDVSFLRDFFLRVPAVKVSIGVITWHDAIQCIVYVTAGIVFS